MFSQKRVFLLAALENTVTANQMKLHLFVATWRRLIIEHLDLYLVLRAVKQPGTKPVGRNGTFLQIPSTLTFHLILSFDVHKCVDRLYIIVLPTSRRRGITVLPTTRGIVRFYLYPLHLLRFLYRFLFSPCHGHNILFSRPFMNSFRNFRLQSIKTKTKEQNN